jgi:hypothetical protein
METYPVDLEAPQIVRWLIEEQRRGTLGFNAVATRSYVTEDLEDSESQQLSEDAEGLSDVLAVGELEIRPPAARDGWALRIRVEDRLGPRLPEDEDAPGEEEEIDLATFETEFILPERGTPEVLLDAEDAQAKARFSRVFKQMLTGQHRSAAKR